MNPYWLLLLTVFFSVFHVLGGGALGVGLRELRSGSDKANFYIVWGAAMGGLPVLFDWFFLVLPGYVLNGLVGPILFLVAFAITGFMDLRIDGAAVLSAVLGSAGLLIGLVAIPLMLDAATEWDLELTDYIFGGLFVLMFVGVGGGFAWNGFSAIIRGSTLDALLSDRTKKYRDQASRPKRKE